MDYPKEKKQPVKKEQNKTTDREEFFGSNKENFAFVPVENIRIIEQVIDKLEEVKHRLNTINDN